MRPSLRSIAFSEAQRRLEELARHVVELDLELVLERPEGKDVALIDIGRLQYYQALEASLDLVDFTHRDSAEAEPPVQPVPTNRTESGPIAMDYSVVNTAVSPRAVLERYRIECELPAKEGLFDLSIRVGDELSGETHLAATPGFDPGDASLLEVLLRALCIARFGSAELPSTADEYGAEFNEVLISVVERNIEFHLLQNPPLLSLSIKHDAKGWTVTHVARNTTSSSVWWLDSSLTIDPLELTCNVAKDLKLPPAYLDIKYGCRGPPASCE